MKYIPLYRKYRPQMLEEVVGQEHIKKALANAIALDKISHAYLFTGPRGTGKTSMARIFAKSLNCKNGPTASPCGMCENCVDITNSTPMDVIEIDAASNRKVEDAQNILEKVMYAPMNSRYKIYIIDEVHMLSTTAFNALLKTLEEPPPNVIFILATTEVHKVLDTIKSRCQRFDFKRIMTDDITAHLRKIADKEKINITDDALAAIAKNSAGGMRDSIALLDQLAVLGSAEKTIGADDINNLLGRLSFDVLAGLTDRILASDRQGAIEDLENIYAAGNEPVLILSGLTDYFKNLLIVKNCRSEIASELTQAAAGQIKTLREQAERAQTHQLVFLIDKAAEYIREIKSSNSPRLWLEVAVIDLANLADNTSLVELQNRIAALESVGKLNGAAPVQKPAYTVPVNSSAPVNPAPAKTPPAEAPAQPPAEASKPALSSSEDLWAKLLDNAKDSIKGLLRQMARPVKISPEETIIEIRGIWFDKFNTGDKRQALVAALDGLFGQTGSNVTVKLPEDGANGAAAPCASAASESAPAVPASVSVASEPEPEPSAAGAEEEFPQNPPAPAVKPVAPSDQVSMVMDLFDGKIIDN